MRIQHNIMAMGAYRNYTNNVNAMKKNLEKLSSGYKINRAGDDAAGLAISEKMRAQITGLETAQKNAKDGISLVQTAEGALTEVHDMLNRMVELATMSANGTYDNTTDRAQLEKEMDQLKDEINRISKATNFNGIDLLNGNYSTKSSAAVGELLSELGVDGSNPTAAGAAVVNFKLTNAAEGAAETVAANKTTDGAATQAGTPGKITLKFGGLTDDEVTAIAGTQTFTPSSGTGTYTDLTSIAANDKLSFEIDGSTVDVTFNAGDVGSSDDKAAAVNAVLSDYGITASANGDALKLEATAGSFAPATAANLKDENGNNATITATTTAADIAKMKIDVGGQAYTIGDYFNVAKDATTGDVTLTAKTAGDLSDASNAANVGNSIAAALTGLTSGLTSATNLDAAKQGSAALTEPGTDAGLVAGPPAANTVYEIDMDWDNVTGGTTFEIGGKKFAFMVDGTADFGAVTINGDNSYKAIDISKAATDAEKATALKNALSDTTNGIGTTDFDFTTPDATTGKFTITGKAVDANGDPDLAKTNLGELRSNVDGALGSSTYTPAADAADNSAPTSPFATAEYNLGELKAGSKVYIGDKYVEVVANASDIKDSNHQVLVGSNAAADMVAAFEKQGIGTGLLSITANAASGSGATAVPASTTLKITGTTIGQEGDDLAAANTVKFLSADDTPTASVAKLGTNTITAGTTDIQTIKGWKVDNQTLGDNFTIKVNNKVQADGYVIQEGDEITITANKNGRLSDAAMANLAVSGDGVATSSVANGYDEGKTAGGDKTTYQIGFVMNKLAGGNTFTIGNEDGKSYTFEISYDADGNKDGTIGSSNKNDVVNNGDSSDRTVINLYGKTEEQAADAIRTAINDKMSTNFDMNSSLVGGKLTVRLTAKEEGDAYNLGNIRTSNQSGALTDLQYNPAGGAANGIEGTYAQVSYKFDASMIQSGDTLTVGGTTIYFGDEDKAESVDGKTKITLDAEEAKSDLNKIVRGLESAGFRSGQVKFTTSDSGTTMTITGIATGETAADLAKAGGKVSYGNVNGREMTTGGLKLQIGDTADSYNQLVVDIAGTNCDDLGISDISVADQTSAQAAVDVIKNAINKVSTIRGTLGATQNRLDHTINNLSVMTENIQDAESTIRDVDVAEEMMAYTKNNILIQSAQAMLAQANQVPQGVLQLLQ